MTIQLRYSNHEGKNAKYENGILNFEGPYPLAPGMPFEIHIRKGEEAHLFQARALGSSKQSQDPPTYRIRARLVNVRREQREWLERMCTGVGENGGGHF
ncbi:MAG: hypothetical protein N2515_00675 [Deltaproteobacteria bacterium]|nr:hypothetical protein [Deltaproteobacteria bacterium]